MPVLQNTVMFLCVMNSLILYFIFVESVNYCNF